MLGLSPSMPCAYRVFTMTRINVIPVQLLSDKHLGAEYRELPRIFGAVRYLHQHPHLQQKIKYPSQYVLGKGHVTFFYMKLGYLLDRYVQLCAECRQRGRVVNYGDAEALVQGIPLSYRGQWSPPLDAVLLNYQRIQDRGGLRPGWSLLPFLLQTYGTAVLKR